MMMMMMIMMMMMMMIPDRAQHLLGDCSGLPVNQLLLGREDGVEPDKDCETGYGIVTLAEKMETARAQTLTERMST